MKNHYLPVMILVLILTSAMFITIVNSESIAREDNTITSDERDHGSKAVLEFNCQSNEPLFVDYSRFFENKNYNAWCEDVLKIMENHK